MSAFVSWFEELIRSTAWTMEIPKSYGAFHLTFTLVGFAVCAFLAWKLRNLGDVGHRRLLRGIGIYLLAAEIYKQFFCYIVYGGYQWGEFPFQFCSIPMYLCFIASFLHPGKVTEGMYHYMMTFNLLGGFVAFLEPSGLLHEYVTMTAHSLIWHMLLVFVGLYLGFSKRTSWEWRRYRTAEFTYLILAAVAFSINLAFWNVSNGDINMFFIGPRNCPLIVFKSIAESCGWYVASILLIFSISLGAFLVFLPFHFVKKRTAEKRAAAH